MGLRIVTKGDEAADLRNLGNIALNQGDWVDAETYYRRSLDVFEGIGDDAGAGSVLAALGAVAWNREAYDDAERFFRRALDRYEDAPEWADERGKLTHDLGVLALRDEDFEAAAEYFRQSAAEFKRADDEREADSLDMLGLATSKVGRVTEAADAFERSLELRRGVGDRVGEAAALSNLGGVDWRQGDFEAARERFESARELSRENGDVSGVAVSEYNLGAVAAQSGQTNAAADHFRRSAEAFEKTGNEAEASSARRALAALTTPEEGDDAADDAAEADESVLTAERTRPVMATSTFGVIAPPASRSERTAPEVSSSDSPPLQRLSGTDVETDEPRNREADDWKTVILRTIPTDIVSAWVLIDALVVSENGSSGGEVSTLAYWLIFLFVLGAVPLTMIRRRSGSGTTLRAGWRRLREDLVWKTQVALSTVSFAVWVFYLGGPFQRYSWLHSETYASIILVLYTFLVIPLAIPGGGGESA